MPGPALVAVPAPDNSIHCIDATPVTQGQYAAFLQAQNGSTAGQPDLCATNTYVPPDPDEDNGPNCDEAYYSPGVHPDNPMACADWCDARAYCAWAGKRLCGAVGGGAIDFPPADQMSPLTGGELYDACSQNGQTKYPYGNDDSIGPCTPKDNGVGAIFQPVASAKECHGSQPPFDQLWDMVGRAETWENRCALHTEENGAKVTICVGRGGYTGLPNSMGTYSFVAKSCDVVSILDYRAFQGRGIRCCADAVAAP